jgi:aspartyl/asparaginyl beta-hydroxylase (cupin superfamily)
VVDSKDVAALEADIKRAVQAGDMVQARSLLERLVKLDGKDQQQWLNLAVACRNLGDDAAEEAAIKGALTVAPSDMLALLMRGELLERQGKMHAAAAAYGGATQVSLPMDQLHPNFRSRVAHAIAFRDRYNQQFGRFLDDYMAPLVREVGGEHSERFRASLDLMFGRKQRYDSRPMNYFFPGLAPIQFFDRQLFPWMEALDAQTDAIRDEFLHILEGEEGFEPYLTYSADQPHNQFAELNNSPRWSAFHLIKDGVTVPANAARAPRTLAALQGVPQPDQPGRTPNAMFSLLKPHTRIPAHVGVANTRLVCHLPLIVPEGCGFRVGNETRAWQVGKTWAFDDTIEHEAWNDSDKLRVVLIFDTWHPHLSEAERAMITEMTRGINAFAQGGGFEL